MKHYYLPLLFLLFIPAVWAQETDLEQEILQYSETKNDLISKGRRLLTDKFLEGDIAKVQEVKDYLLNEVEDESYTALYPGEIWMILYWTGGYEALTESILGLNEEKIAAYTKKISPPRDFLYARLVERSWENIEMLENKILDSNLETVQKDFLLLHLNYMLSGEPLMKVTQEEVNQMADLYLETHPGSPYEDYIRNNIRFHFVPKNWALGFEFFSGYGILTGELGEQYTNNVPIGFDFDVEYKKFTLFLRAYIGIGQTAKDREFSSGIWEKGSSANIALPEASIGYAIAENDKIKLSPFVGIGAAEITAVQVDIDKYPELDDAMLVSAAYTLGLNTNFKLGWNASTYGNYNGAQDKSYWFLRVRYGYTLPQFNEVGHHGNIHHITIGIGGIYRGMKRAI